MLSNLTIFDFETSGLDPEKDRVIEMAAIRVINGNVVSEFSTLVNSSVQLSPKITEIIGITQDELSGGMPETDSFRILNRFLGDSLIVAHNAAFDLGFLHYSLMRNAGRTFIN